MDALWKIALRNVFRHRRRTIITGVVMMVGIGIFIAYDSILAGMDRLSIDTMVSYSSSYLKVRTLECVADETGTPLDYGIPEPARVMEAVKKAAPSLSAVAPRSFFLAEASNYGDAEPVMAAAVEPGSDAKVFDLAANIAEGSWLKAEGDHEVVVAASVARDLGLKLGDAILLSARTIYDNDNADEFRIVGIADGGLSLNATATVYMNYADARAFLGEALPITEIDAAAPRASSLEGELAASAKAAALVAAALPKLRADPIGEFAKDYLAIKDSKQKATYMIVFFILLIAAVGIVNTILMSVYSRIREIGVLRAYGMTPKDIKALFVREGLIIGALGSAAGLLLGGGLVLWSQAGLNLSALFGNIDLGAFPMNGVIYGEFRPSTYLAGLLFGLLASWLAARIPAKRAGKLEPTDALRFV
jgi:ABC-type lipoprotein release transport system permease subunit